MSSVCTKLTGLKLQSLLDLLTCCPVPATVILLVRSDRPLGATLFLSSLTFWMSFCCRGLMASKVRGRPALSFSLWLRGLLLCQAWCLIFRVLRKRFSWSGGQLEMSTWMFSGSSFTVHFPSLANLVKSLNSFRWKLCGTFPSWTRRIISWNSFRPRTTEAFRMTCLRVAWPEAFSCSTVTQHCSWAPSSPANIGVTLCQIQ